MRHAPGKPQPPASGFALITTLIFLAILLGLIVLLASSVGLKQRKASNERHADSARQSALSGLKIAMGELQSVAGPDQRITANASILGDGTNAHTGGITPSAGRAAWTGVWTTETYSPATPDAKSFAGWLVSATDVDGNFTLPTNFADTDEDNDVDPDEPGFALRDPITLFSNSDPNQPPYMQAGMVHLDDVPAGQRYFAFAVEDESVKADLSWNETPLAATSAERVQSSRLSGAPGPDYAIFNDPVPTGAPAGTQAEPFGTQSYPLNKINQMRDPADLQTSLGASENWLRDQRANITWGSRGVLADVKKGGLRRDLSLAFEMDGAANSENATNFNNQDGEFVGGGAPLVASQVAPGMAISDRYLYRDYSTAGNPFSSHIKVAETVVRGPNWWVLRDYANLYKSLTPTAGGGYAMDARAYFPNRAQGEDLFDIHAQKNNKDDPIQVLANRETNTFGAYAYRPVRASYAPVLLGVNAIYSLVYKDDRLKMVVDPFFIIWNPYDTMIEADSFAITLENGFAGGIAFRIARPGVDKVIHGTISTAMKDYGSDTSLSHYAKNKTGVNAHMSYLISGLAMEPGEVLIYSPPDADDRGSNANALNDELVPGMNYNITTSGIFFDEFPDDNVKAENAAWDSITVPTADAADTTIEVMFNLRSAVNNGHGVNNHIETNLPVLGTNPDALTTEANFGAHVAGKEFRLNLQGQQFWPNIDKGKRFYSHDYTFKELNGVKKSFGILSMLTMPTDHDEIDTPMEVFSHLNVTPTVCTNTEVFNRAPANVVIKVLGTDGINNLMNEVGVDIDAFDTGDNGHYGMSYSGGGVGAIGPVGDTHFPLLSIPKSPLHSLVQLSGANIGTRLLEPTHAIGNSWVPPYLPTHSIYGTFELVTYGNNTFHDSSWLINDALFDRYFFSGIAPDLSTGATLATSVDDFFSSDYQKAAANPFLAPHNPQGTDFIAIEDEFIDSTVNPPEPIPDGYRKVAAYSMLNGAFNVNSTSVEAWTALLRGNKDLSVTTLQGGIDSELGTPLPLSTTPSDTPGSTNGWEELSRLDDAGIGALASAIVDEVKQRGPFMSISDFVNRRISSGVGSYQGAIQAAIEQARTNDTIEAGTTNTIRDQMSPIKPDYTLMLGVGNKDSVFKYANADYVGNRNSATGIPMEINQANVLLPIASRLTARADTFRIRSYGEVRHDSNGKVLSRATCEAVVQRVPEYVDDAADNPWVDPENLTSGVNQDFGRRFKIVQLRWLAPDEL